METAVLIASVIILIVSILLFLKKSSLSTSAIPESESLRAINEQLRISLAKSEERTRLLENDRQLLNGDLKLEREKAAQISRELESSKSYYQAQQEKIAELNLERDKNQEKFNKDFELIASRILDEKTLKFTDQNKTNLDILLSPLKDNIKAFEEKVDKVYKIEADERNILKGVITQLMDLNKMMSVETQNLTRALKGDNKKQGNWGEMILERVLERSGLVKDQEYRVQAGMQSADGNRFLPDVIIDLPDNKHLIVDSKVSLTAYARLVDCESEADKDLYIKQHITSLRNHITDLSAKNYSDLYKINSPDFVMLFIPIESCFSIAVQKDADLFNYAWDKRVVIVSPSTLLATLRTIASIWKQERQNRNVMEIARLSGEMYDKFVGFAGDMDSIGKNIKQSQDAYDKAFNKLSSGRGNLAVTAEKIKKLGAKAGKQIDQKLLNELED